MMQSISKELKQEKAAILQEKKSPGSRGSLLQTETSAGPKETEKKPRSLFTSPVKKELKEEDDPGEARIGSFELEEEEDDLEDGIVHSPKIIEGYSVEENKNSKELKELIHNCLVASMSLTRNPPSHFLGDQAMQEILKTAYRISEKTFHNMNSILIQLHEKLAKQKSVE
jgi:hypothetical protein